MKIFLGISQTDSTFYYKRNYKYQIACFVYDDCGWLWMVLTNFECLNSILAIFGCLFVDFNGFTWKILNGFGCLCQKQLRNDNKMKIEF